MKVVSAVGIIRTIQARNTSASSAGLREAFSALGLDVSAFPLVIEQMRSGLALAEAPSGSLVVHNPEGHAARGRLFAILAVWCALHKDGSPYRPEAYPIARALSGETVIDHVMR